MRYKEDWPVTQNRLQRFWEGDLEGCCLAVTAPRDKPADSRIQYREPENLEDKWLNKELRLHNWLYEFSNTFYGGDAFPNLVVDMGPGAPAAFVGAKPTLGGDSIWFHGNKVLRDFSKRPKLTINYNCEWWKLLWEMTEYFCQNANGDYFVSINDLGGTLDIAASLRGVQQILFDIMDEPDEVKAITRELDDIWLETFWENHRLISRYMRGCTEWMNVWCHKTVYSIQCDLATMLSPDQYAEFARPSIERQVSSLDYSMYHLHMYDTPGLSAQLDIMLDIEKLDAIAFIPETPYAEGHGDARWFPYYKRIQEKGKKLMMYSVDPMMVLRFLEELSPKGLHIHTNCASEEEAKALLNAAGKYIDE